MMRRIRIAAFAVALAAVPAAGHAAAIGYTNMFVFGDSLSDNGNVYDAAAGIIPAPPYVDGRFSNGPIYAEYMADRLGLPLDNVLSGGTNYAFGGAGTDFGVPEVFGESPLSVQSQVNLFQTQRLFNGADPNALYILYAGANNLERGVDAAAANPADAVAIRQNTAREAVADIIGMIDLLHRTGAQHFLVPNAAPLGAAPANSAVDALATSFSIDFNTQLAAAVTSLSGPSVTVFDTFGLAESVLANPLAFGFADVSNACLTDASYFGGGTVCSEPDLHLFWDHLHLTTAANQILANAMLGALNAPPPHPVPIPAAIYLFGAAISVLGAMSRLRR